MISSQSSIDALDPLSEVIAALGVGHMRRTRLEAAGDWALQFSGLARLKFVAILRGRCWITLPEAVPLSLGAGDTFVIGNTSYVVASDPKLEPLDGALLYRERDSVRLNGDDTVMLGGGITLDSDRMRFLMDALPPFIFIPAQSPAASVLGIILDLLDREVGLVQPGRSLVTARLADILLVQALRAHVAAQGVGSMGWIGALADVRIGAALRSMHADVARTWTVAMLASKSGMSRSAFAQRFSELVRKPPSAYLRDWRMTLARKALVEERCSIAALSARLGYASESAFGHAYKRQFGCAPRRTTRRQYGLPASNSGTLPRD